MAKDHSHLIVTHALNAVAAVGVSRLVVDLEADDVLAIDDISTIIGIEPVPDFDFPATFVKNEHNPTIGRKGRNRRKW